MLTSTFITKAAKNFLEEHGIPVVPENTTNPQQQIADQYDAVRDAYERLDHQAFIIGRSFLEDVAKYAPDDLTVRALRAICNIAFNRPNMNDAVLLEAYLADRTLPNIQARAALADINRDIANVPA